MSHFLGVIWRLRGGSWGNAMPFSVPRHYGKQIGDLSGGEARFFVSTCARGTRPVLFHKGCRAARLKECQSALLNGREFLQKERLLRRGGLGKARERAVDYREWRHCERDRRVIWPRWKEWWYANKRVTDTKETGGCDCAAFDTFAENTPRQTVNHSGSVDSFSPVLNQVLKRVLLLCPLCVPDSFSSSVSFLPWSKISPYRLTRINQSDKLNTCAKCLCIY